MIIDTESLKMNPDNFFMCFELTGSAECDSSESDKKINGPTCTMVTGYVSGWVSTVFETPLVATEVACKCSGVHSSCKFIVSNPEKVKNYVNHVLKVNKEKNSQLYSNKMETIVNLIMSV